MRVVYYTHPAFFEPALCLVKELSRHLELHLLLEVSPEAWQTAGFDASRQPLPAGLVPGDPVLKNVFPAGVRAYWQSAASFHLVNHSSRRSLHPSSWAVGRKALRFTSERQVDVLHVDDVDVSPRLALALPGSRRPPIVLSVHDPEPHSGERNWRKRLARRIVYPMTDRFVLHNRASVETFAARYGIAPASIQVAPLGVYDVLREWPAEVPGVAAPSVLFFGRLSEYKGLDVFYEAARLIAQRTTATFVVAGQAVPGYVPPLPPALEGGSELRVIEGYVSNSAASALLQAASVVVCPYRDATQSGVVLTAFAFGAPVVASAVGGLPDYVAHERTGLLVPAGDPAALADAICRILLDGAFAAQLRNGVSQAGQDALSWRRTADALLGVYASVRRSS